MDSVSGGKQKQASDARERTGLAISAWNASEALSNIVAAEAAGVRQVWSTQILGAPDTLTAFAAGAVKTTSVRMGTAIAPTYPRHPLALAQQALALHDLAPGRLRLGVGPSHRSTVEGAYGIPMGSPMEHLREYVAILRALLWEGKVSYEGRYYKVNAQMPRTTQTPVLISALRLGAFRLAGEISDGAISWMCPLQYLLEKALPALREGANEAGRPAPPLIAHIPVALSTDRQAVRAASRKQLDRYARLPYYSGMFTEAGFPAQPDGTLAGALIDNLVVWGDNATVAASLERLRSSGLDELLLYSVPVSDPASEMKSLMELIGAL